MWAPRARWATACHSGRVCVGVGGLAGKGAQFAGAPMLGGGVRGWLAARGAKGVSMGH